MKIIFLLILGMSLLCFGCRKELIVEEEPETTPFGNIASLEFIANTCALKVTGFVVGFVDSEQPSEYGFVYATGNDNPTLDDYQVEIKHDFVDGNTFSTVIDYIEADSTYFFKTYVKYGGETFYTLQSKMLRKKSLVASFAVIDTFRNNCDFKDMSIDAVIEGCLLPGVEFGIVFFDYENLEYVNQVTVKAGVSEGQLINSFTSGFKMGEGQREHFAVYIKRETGEVEIISDFSDVPRIAEEPEISVMGSFPGTPRVEATSFVIDGKGYICGGTNLSSTVFYNDLWEYTPEIDSWERKADFPAEGRAWMSSFSVSHYGYVGLGASYNLTLSSDFFRYDPYENSWSSIAKFPEVGHAGVSFVVEDEAFVGGNLLDSTGISRKFYKYEEENDLWTEVATFPVDFFNARNVAMGIDDKGYVIFGQSNKTTIYSYSPSEDSWYVTFENLSFAGEDGLVFTKDGLLYLITGFHTRTAIAFDPEAKSYKSVCAPLEIRLRESVGFELTGSFYIATGQKSSFNNELNKFVFKVEIFP